jgi:hypothetical protein
LMGKRGRRAERQSREQSQLPFHFLLLRRPRLEMTAVDDR